MKRKIAIPLAGGKLCPHFGHCETFALWTIEDGKITNREFLSPPDHQPGSFPRFLASHGATDIIAGGLGIKAQELFRHFGIQVCVGAGSDDPDELVERYVKGKLTSGLNLCDH